MTIYIFCYLRKDDRYWEMSIKCQWSVIFLTGWSETWNQLLFLFGPSGNGPQEVPQNNLYLLNSAYVDIDPILCELTPSQQPWSGNFVHFETKHHHSYFSTINSTIFLICMVDTSTTSNIFIASTSKIIVWKYK
jgi:hypothetical protein